MSDDFFRQSFTPARGGTTGGDGSTSTSTSTGNMNANANANANATGNGSGRRPKPPPPPPNMASRGVNVNSRPTGNYYSTGVTVGAGSNVSAGTSAPPAPTPTPFTGYNPYGGYTNSGGASAGPRAGPNTTNESAPVAVAAAPSLYGSRAPAPAPRVSSTNNMNGTSIMSSGSGDNRNANDNDDWFSSAQNEVDVAPASGSTAGSGSISGMGMHANMGVGVGMGVGMGMGVNNMNMNTAAAAAPTVAPNAAAAAAPTYMNPYATSNTSNSGSQNSLTGTMSSSDNNININNSSTQQYQYDFENEPPLLEELGINISHIKTKSLAVILPFKYAKTVIDTSIMEDNDLAGPLVFGLLLGTELFLAGRIQYGYIYGFGLFGTLMTTLVLNLMSPSDSISVWTVVSILGYSLLPVNLLAAINVFYRIRYMGVVGVVLAALTIMWCTLSSTRLVERGCGMRDQRFLVGYPNALLYSAFVMITIF